MKLETTNGDIQVTDLTGMLTVETTNGRVRPRASGNGAKVETTNGAITLDFAKVGDAGITCETTNGAIHITIPANSKASVSARVSNGAIVTEEPGPRGDRAVAAAARRVDRRRRPRDSPETTNGVIELKGR